MPEIDFLALVRFIREESASLGHPLSKNEARRCAGYAVRSAEFEKWCREIDEHDALEFGEDHNPHSDTTARKAIRRALRAQFNYQRKEQAA